MSQPEIKSVFMDWRIALFASLTLGLAPFSEPHIIGKIQWIAGGAVGMKGIDWFDTFQHGLPWIWLFVILILKIKNKIRSR